MHLWFKLELPYQLLKKVTIKIKPMESFVAGNIIFGRNIGGFKQVTYRIKFDVFSCIKATIMQFENLAISSSFI